MNTSIKLLILCVVATIACTIIEYTIPCLPNGDSFLSVVSFLGMFGMVISFISAIVEIHKPKTDIGEEEDG